MLSPPRSGAQSRTLCGYVPRHHTLGQKDIGQKEQGMLSSQEAEGGSLVWRVVN